MAAAFRVRFLDIEPSGTVLDVYETCTNQESSCCIPRCSMTQVVFLSARLSLSFHIFLAQTSCLSRVRMKANEVTREESGLCWRWSQIRRHIRISGKEMRCTANMHISAVISYRDSAGRVSRPRVDATLSII